MVSHKLTETTIKAKKTKETTQLELLYQQIRDFREGTNTTISRNKVFQEVKVNYPQDWLLSVELYELAVSNGDEEFAAEIVKHLEKVKQENPKLGNSQVCQLMFRLRTLKK